MSKMFDALRRAEAERRKRITGDDDVASIEARPARVPKDKVPAARHSGAPQPRPRPLRPSTTPARPTEAREGLDPTFMRELGILRNSIESQLGQSERRTILFTSSAPEEGTTTIALSYAHLLAMKGDRKVLVVECNARTPAFFWHFGLKQPEGVTDYLESDRPLASYVQSVPGAGFDVVVVGRGDAGAMQLHAESDMPRLFADAARYYDTVIVDSAPIVVSPETPPLCALVDGVVVVVRTERTKREIVQRSLGVAAKAGGRALGVVLNRKRYYIPDFIYRRI